MSGEFKKILILPRLKIHNANALSSPFTIGFPAMTAWLGATHALQRKLNAKGIKVVFNATGVVSHAMDLQTYRGENDYVASIIGTGNPLTPKSEKNKPEGNAVRPSFVEEARCHLDVSLIIELQGIKQQQEDELKEAVSFLLHARMKIAGGDIEGFDAPEIIIVEKDNDSDLRRLKRKLMPGYVLIERRDLMAEAMEQGQDAMEALLDYLAIHHSCEQDNDGVVTWRSKRKSQTDKPAGWIVPIATGFHGISEPGQAKNQRDPAVPHRFAESLVTLGEFKMPYRFTSVEKMLWHYHFDPKNNLYQCRPLSESQNKTETLEEEFS